MIDLSDTRRRLTTTEALEREAEAILDELFRRRDRLYRLFYIIDSDNAYSVKLEKI